MAHKHDNKQMIGWKSIRKKMGSWKTKKRLNEKLERSTSKAFYTMISLWRTWDCFSDFLQNTR